jgi:hypothetical protein
MNAAHRRPSPRTLLICAIWTGLLVVALGLLYGRYDWDLEGGRFAERGFVLSAYLLVLLLPTCFYLFRYVLHNALVAALVTAFVFVLTTLPYKLLGLDKYYYYRVRPQVFTIEQFPPSLEFFPSGTLHAFPFYWLFTPMLFTAGAAVIWGTWWIRSRAGFMAARRIPALLTIAFALICSQAYLHSGMRAPYTYVNHLDHPKAEAYWYQVYYFGDGSGATNADQFVFSPLEDYFQGAPRDGNNMLVRRPFSFYLSSQLSYFVNTFYVWLAFNCLAWLAAVVATGRLVSQLVSERAGIIAAALTVVGPGFVAFVATPAMYLQNYAAVAVALMLFQDLVVKWRGRDLGRLAVFTGALALCSLVYELGPLLLVLLVYGLTVRIPWTWLVLSLAAAFVTAHAFPLLVTHVLGISIDPTNQEQLSQAIRKTTDFALHPSLAAWYDQAVTVIPSYGRLLLQAFFAVPFVVAVLGLRRVHGRPLVVLVGSLFAMGFATIAVLQVGESGIGTLPRLVYPIFPAVYLLAALALDAWSRPSLRTAWPQWRGIGARLRIASPWVVVGAMAVLVNIDIFGFPTLYVEYLTGGPPVFLP